MTLVDGVTDRINVGMSVEDVLAFISRFELDERFDTYSIYASREANYPI